MDKEIDGKDEEKESQLHSVYSKFQSEWDDIIDKGASYICEISEKYEKRELISKVTDILKTSGRFIGDEHRSCSQVPRRDYDHVGRRIDGCAG